MENSSALFKEAFELIASSRRIILATHENPDGDGLSAMLATLFFLQELGKEVLAYAKGDLPVYLQFLPGTNYIRREIPQGEYDLLIGFDYGDFKRLELDDWLGSHARLKVITVDHHPRGRHKGDVQIIDTEAASTTVIVRRLLAYLQKEISPEIATCILTGIVIDTGGFMHANTNPEALSVAAEMMKKGANLSRILRESFRKKDPLFLRLWGEALLRARVDPKSGMVVSRVTAEDFQRHGATKEVMVEFSGVLNTIADSRCAVFLSQDSEEPEFIKGSLRSEAHKNVDVSALAAFFGGGGHKLASGFKIEGRWTEVIEKLIREARRMNGKE